MLPLWLLSMYLQLKKKGVRNCYNKPGFPLEDSVQNTHSITLKAMILYIDLRSQQNFKKSPLHFRNKVP